MDPFAIDWRTAFVPTVPPAELILRGTIVYLVLFSFMRFVLKREGGNIGLADLLMTVLIADAAQNAMASEYKSITDGLLLVGTIVFWNYMLDFLAFRFPALRWFVEPSPLKLVDNGRLLYRNMRKELISRDELLSQIREEGLEDLSQVKVAYMEGDGHISVIRKQTHQER